MDLIKRFTAWTLLFVGLSSCLLGFVIASVETFHIFLNVHTFEYPPFIASALFIIGGAALVQTKSVNDTLGVLVEALPLVRNRRISPPVEEQEVKKS